MRISRVLKIGRPYTPVIVKGRVLALTARLGLQVHLRQSACLKVILL